MLTSTRMITLMCLGVAVAFAAPGLRHAVGHFDDWKPPEASQMVVPSSVLSKVFNEGLGNVSAGEKNIVSMEAAMQPTYNALPKNRYGLLPRNAIPYIVQKYAMQEYHYSIRGLGPETPSADTKASDHSSNLQHTSVPGLLQTLLESRQAGHGLALRDAASLVVMMRKLVMDLDVDLMYQAFHTLNDLNMFANNESDLHDMSIPAVVKAIWAWEWLHWHDLNEEDALGLFVDHVTVPTHVMDEFGKLAVNLMEAKFYRERGSRNPFKPKTISFMDTVQMAHEVTQAMGVWQDHDCKKMKRYLIKLDPEKDGRVPLNTVLNQEEVDDANGEQVFRFSESQDYLREIGGLDESDPSNPQVLISNYVLGPANCYRSVAFHTFCCLNECDAVLTEVERVVGGPSAKTDILLPLLGNLTTGSMDEPRPLSASLVAKLSGIAAHSGGMVPLHGRLFTQWLHFAFPHECPYPHVTHKDGAGNALTTSYFQAAADTMAQWTDDEMLPLIEVENNVILGGRGILRASVMLLAVLAMCNQIRTLASAHTHKLTRDVMGVDLEKCV